jgi:hypothetical protein
MQSPLGNQILADECPVLSSTVLHTETAHRQRKGLIPEEELTDPFYAALLISG